MKVVLATPLYPPEIGGPATYAKLMEAELPRRGIEVAVVKFNEVRHARKFVRHYQYYRRVYKEARGAHLVLALDPVSTGLPALFAARRANRPFVVKIGGDYAWEQGVLRFGITAFLDDFVRATRVPLLVRALQRVQSYVTRRASMVIVPSEYLKRIVMTWGVSEERVVVIYNAVEVPPLGNVPQSVHNLSRPFVVTAGRLVPWKQIDGVIDAIACTSELSLVVVGDGPERRALEERARALKARVIFTGQLSHEDLLATIKASNALVLNSSYEGLSHLLIEATLLEVPIIATRAGGNAEVVREGVTGTLVPVGDNEALLKALTKLPRAQGEQDARFRKETMLNRTTELLSTL